MMNLKIIQINKGTLHLYDKNGLKIKIIYKL